MALLYERWESPPSYSYIVCGANFFGLTFTIGTTGLNISHRITSVKLLMIGIGLPGIFTIGIRATDDAGKPTGNNLTTGTYDGDTIPPFPNLIEINVAPYRLFANKKYAIIVDCSGGSRGNIVLLCSAYYFGYSGGSLVYSTDSGASWDVNPDVDVTFCEYGLVVEKHTHSSRSIEYVTGKELNWFKKERLKHSTVSIKKEGDRKNGNG